ncbi:DUF1499 domain-containing protein [Prochlorococcus marinus]|uniref:DUF1499 domain-containing protein n=1 Tax=Prochlorococcus marinus XMU1408 TaxID=2213228 RepID=A0A318R561_PROMR|nr:DUF1499 domain-containing protein [Prochlorococcus marinus]MBW3042125.1 DUF1499 domain-containing protein [Prochlorococcus marinus str. XMU1408]PYE03240.1 DUF1499 domain-containing protein [Prochlorococcus marinus XMU1408]
MPDPKSGLCPCLNPLNCVFFQKEFEDVDKTFEQLIRIAQEIPRTKVLEVNDKYWKGVCRSLIFRFPDDLEILKIDKKIQIKSASRYGGGDLGVNGTRVGKLLTALEKSNS